VEGVAVEKVKYNKTVVYNKEKEEVVEATEVVVYNKEMEMVVYNKEMEVVENRTAVVVIVVDKADNSY
jgi:hypothetical protein